MFLRLELTDRGRNEEMGNICMFELCWFSQCVLLGVILHTFTHILIVLKLSEFENTISIQK